MGIYLRNATGADGVGVNDTLVSDLHGSYTYYIDVQPGELFFLTGDFDNNIHTMGDGPSSSGSGMYVATGVPDFGFFFLSYTTGQFEFRFSAADLIANGGLDQTISFQIRGMDGIGATDIDTIYIDVSCFLEGTEIATANGSVPVEALEQGERVLTADGRDVAVKWIGRQTISTRFGPTERLMPVRVRAGALGDGLPQRDLVPTADHALLIDGLLINAGALVNGASIDWVPVSELGERFTVYHVETEDHDIILAEGAPAETFIDYVGRQAFDNYAEYVALYGEERIITEMPYPRISTPRLLPPALKARLAGRLAA